MKLIINKALIGSNAINPIESGKVALFDWPTWVGYTFGSLFIVIGILVCLLGIKTKARADQYKKEQLENFNKKNKRKVTDYRSTGMYLPAWEKIKMSWPIFVGVTCVFVGIAWMVGNSLSTL